MWGALFAVGDYAWRLNLLSAVMSAGGAGFLYLCADRALAGEAPLVRTGGALAGTLVAAFTFTLWQNSNETEVYAIATATACACAWLAVRWRDLRGTARAPHLLLLAVYLLALSLGNHLLALLTGPALIAFVWHVQRTAPAPDPAERDAERVALLALAAVWVLLVATGLGNTGLLLAGAVACVAVVVYGAVRRSPGFAILAVAVAVVGASTYLFLYLRSGLDPILDMADPETWDRLIAVIRREQYPARSPFDNPLFPHGTGNPGRTPALVVQQLVNYFQYFNWQWGHALGNAQLVPMVVFAGLGVLGWSQLLRRDRSLAWLLGGIFLVTGLGLVAYMNFKPGFSLFWDKYPTMDQHEVRERDYFFVLSFQIWGLVAGLGLAALARGLKPRLAVGALAVALVPAALNFTVATRRGPEEYVARDFAWNMLQSVRPYGVLFVLGDNDTYPLWYAQEVQGVRQDVQVVNLMLANANWYLAQMGRAPRPFVPGSAPAWPGETPSQPTDPLLAVPESALTGLTMFRLDRDVMVRAGRLTVPFRAGQWLTPRDQAVLVILQQHLGKRPIAYAISSGRGGWLGFEGAFAQRGLVYEVMNDTSGPPLAPGLDRVALDTAATRVLADSVFRYAGLLERDDARLESSARQIAVTIAAPLLELAQARGQAGDSAGTLGYLRRAARLSPSPQLAALIAEIEARGLQSVFGAPGNPPRR